MRTTNRVGYLTINGSDYWEIMTIAVIQGKGWHKGVY